MLSSLILRLRQLSRRGRQPRQLAALNQADAAALATQAAPQATRVLVVRHDSIGDYLLFRPWLRQLAAVVRGRGQHLTLLANALWAPLALAWDADCFDELLPLETGRFIKDPTYRADLLGVIGQAGFGEVINPLHVREPAVENFIRFMRAPVRVASQGAHQVSPWFGILNTGYTQLLPSAREVLFEYDRNQEFFVNWLSASLIPNATPTTPLPNAPLRLPTSVPAAAAAEAAAGPYIVLFPGASAQQKRWPVAHFAQLARALHQHYGPPYRLLIAGSPADAAHARRMMQQAGPGVPLASRCGQTDLPGLAALVAGARLLISNDTVAAHLAAQAGTPCLVLLMGENYGKFFPYPPWLLHAACRCLFPPSQEARFAQGDFSPPAKDPDIGQIAVARALTAALELLPGA
ncbi:glycosyltransferase family 9 protein [Hymenobacter sp. H14-R3]|uniref:glycosyltransferase family 9 protein n=1 Tax=Hymenobacter sp. H14-R3 TaxID=3046308 RepID=UPI0024B891FC|nr:glycosyltransferase family 9 protein [Hymenobacter sp. H14-R3]MDJ0364276.1 glycosyltransferase family 9 protein [Hymenobacter sp. H14-R3]